MTRLDWEEHNNSRGYWRSAEYRGLVIKEERDDSPSMPWESMDGNAPLLYYSEGMADHSGADDIESPLHGMTDGYISRNFAKLCKALGTHDTAAADKECRDNQADYGGRLADVRRDYLENLLAELVPSGSRAWGAACDYFAALEELWRMRGVAALDFQRNGYSQGDSIRGLLVATPAWRERVGIPAGHDMRADLESQADLLGAWAFGDVYGYVIETADGADLDSVWGFYGDSDKSGLEESAVEMADSILASAAKRRGDKLKELIRARVPLHLRSAILAEAGAVRSAFA